MEGAGEAAKGIVGIGAGAVEADVHHGDAEVTQMLQAGTGGERGGRGRDGHAEAALHGVLNDLEEVAAHHRVPAREDENGRREIDELLDDLKGFGGGELAGVGFGLCLGATVAAGEGTRAGQFPGHGKGALVKVDGEEVGLRGGSTRPRHRPPPRR